MRARTLGALITAGGLVLAAGLLSAAWAQIDLPPRRDRSVHDLAGVLQTQQVQALERIHRELFDKTGVAIIVITVPRLEGEPIGDFALRVGSEWGVGKKGEDRGIVVALAIEERRVQVETGYGVEGFLPDGRVGGILDQYVIPSLRQDDYGAAMLRASAALVAASAAEYGVSIEGIAARPPPSGRQRSARGGPVRGVFAILMIIVMVYLAIRHPRLFFLMLLIGMGRGGFGGGSRGGFGGGSGFGGFGGGGFGGGGAGRGF